MVIYGYAIDSKYSDSGELSIQTRIPNIHGPMVPEQYNGKNVRNFVKTEDLPWYPSILLPYIPNYGAVVALIPTNIDKEEYMVIGLTGGYYTKTLEE